MMHQDDAARIFQLEGPTGIRIKLKKTCTRPGKLALELSKP
jgi:lipoprotein-releasing system permease protein